MRNRPLCSLSLALFIILGILIHVGGEKFVKELHPSALEQTVPEKEEIQLSGRVYQKESKEEYQILYLKNNSILYQEQSLKESKIIIYDDTKQNVHIGNHVLVMGEVKFYENARNPGNFDQKLYYQRMDIHASLWASSVEVTDRKTDKLKESLSVFREHWKEMLCARMEEEDAMTLGAMLLGDKAGMSRELKALYQVNGIGHILAISGLHLSFIGIGMYRILRRISGSYIVGGTAGILFLGIYILMIGFTVSAVRALVMFLFRVGADMTGRHYDSPTALAVSAVIVLLWRPLFLYDGGFWLSFGAVLAVIVILPVFQGLPVQGFWASVSINLTLLPVILYYFYEFPIYSVVLNLFIIPLMSVVLFSGLAGSVLCLTVPPVSLGDTLFLKLCEVIFRIYKESCSIAVSLPGARVVVGQPEMWQIVIYYVCFGMAIIYMTRHDRIQADERKRKRSMIPFCLALVGTLLLITRFGESDKLTVTVLDVGQGDGIYIKGPQGGTYFIDGGSSDVKKVGQYRIEPFLKSQGTGRLDYVFLSHSDSDHINGIEEMIEREKIGVEIGALVLPVREMWDERFEELAQNAIKHGITVAVIEPGQTLKEGTMSLTCIQPDENFAGEVGNASSMILALSWKGFDMLFTGDVEDAGEEALLEMLEGKYSEKSFEVLKAAHHGSRNSSSEEFLEEVQPVYTIISAGKDNRYGHPHQETLDRLKDVKSKVYCTQECGAVMVEMEKRRFMIRGYCN